MAFTVFQKYLLVRIANGESIFSFESEKMTIEQFQIFAKALIELHKAGQIHIEIHRNEQNNEDRYIDGIYNCRLNNY